MEKSSGVSRNEWNFVECFLFFFFFGVKFGIFFIDQRELKVGTGNVDFQYFDFEGKLRGKLVVEILAFLFIGEWKDYFETIVKVMDHKN